MEASKLKEILEQHKLWLDGKGGSRANLYGADLSFANLKDANLYGADLTGANLYRAKLTGANLSGADLSGANLEDAILNIANLRDANLEDVSFINANFYGANLANASLTRANLAGAILAGATLTDAILPDISWIIPGCLAKLNNIDFYLAKEGKWVNFIQDSIGFFIQDNVEEKTFDILLEDRIIRGIHHWVKYSGMKQILA
jgi:uncharacterized protein YjbI with pentapeptide repeats